LKKKASNEIEEIKPEDQEEDDDDDDNDDGLSILESHHSKGNRFYYEEHEYKNAIEEYEKALKEEKDELIKAKIIYQIAESYVKLGNHKKARELFQSLAQKYKEHHIYDSAKKRLEHLGDYLVEKEEKKSSNDQPD
jgi:tetratricopeptide (TPR) repeat protein